MGKKRDSVDSVDSVDAADSVDTVDAHEPQSAEPTDGSRGTEPAPLGYAAQKAAKLRRKLERLEARGGS